MGLPNTYFKLKCIESSGTQYIDTGVPCGDMNSYKLTADMETTTADYGDSYPFIRIYIAGTRFVAIVPTSATQYKLQIGGTNKQKQFSVDSVANRHTITLDLVESKGIVDENEQSLDNATNSIDGNIILFAGNNNGTVDSSRSRTRLYGFKTYENGTLIRDYIPAMRKSDSVVGLYDLVNDVFYTNAGSGTFSYEAQIDAVKVTQNTTSYTFTEKGLYVFTGSVDGGYQPTLGGTCTQMYFKQSYAGTVAILWAEAGQTLTASAGSYNQLVRVTGIDKKPKIKYSAENPSITKSGNADDIFIGMAVGHYHSDTSTSYSFTCSGFKREVAHSSSGWSKNAMALMIPFSTSNVNVTVTGASGKYQGFLVQISTGGSIRIKISGSWKEGTTYIKVNGSWKTGEVKVKNSGSWKGA